MREKLRKIREKEEGFTLVELLAVIVILGIILAIAIPSVGNVIKNAEDDATEAEYGMIVDAGRLYLTTEEDDNGERMESVQVSTLVDGGYIEERDDEIDADIKGYHVVKKDNSYNLYEDKEGEKPVKVDRD